MPQRRAVATAKTASAVNVEEEVPLASASNGSSKQRSSPKGPATATTSTTSIELLETKTPPTTTGSSNNDKESNKSPEKEHFDRKVQHWRESPFAVGLKNITWTDEANSGNKCCGGDEHGDGADCLCFSAFCCPKFGAGRVGNMIVCKQTTEWVEEIQDDEETGEEIIVRVSRPKLQILMGPYWPLLCFVTYPLILGISGWTLVSAIPGKSFPVILAWFICTIGLIVALALTAFRDPGILYKHSRPPPNTKTVWRWSDTGLTFRPRGAVYDPDTGVVVEQFDHT